MYASDKEALEALNTKQQQLLQEIGKVIVGQDQVIREVTTAIFAGGHVLLVGVPGLAKTLFGQHDRTGFGTGIQPRPVHAGFDAKRHRGIGDSQRTAPIPIHEGAVVCQHRAGRRNQPDTAENTVRPARSDARAVGDGGRSELSVALLPFLFSPHKTRLNKKERTRCLKRNSTVLCSTHGWIIRRMPKS